MTIQPGMSEPQRGPIRSYESISKNTIDRASQIVTKAIGEASRHKHRLLGIFGRNNKEPEDSEGLNPEQDLKKLAQTISRHTKESKKFGFVTSPNKEFIRQNGQKIIDEGLKSDDQRVVTRTLDTLLEVARVVSKDSTDWVTYISLARAVAENTPRLVARSEQGESSKINKVLGDTMRFLGRGKLQNGSEVSIGQTIAAAMETNSSKYIDAFCKGALEDDFTDLDYLLPLMQYSSKDLQGEILGGIERASVEKKTSKGPNLLTTLRNPRFALRRFMSDFDIAGSDPYLQVVKRLDGSDNRVGSMVLELGLSQYGLEPYALLAKWSQGTQQGSLSLQERIVRNVKDIQTLEAQRPGIAKFLFDNFDVARFSYCYIPALIDFYDNRDKIDPRAVVVVNPTADGSGTGFDKKPQEQLFKQLKSRGVQMIYLEPGNLDNLINKMTVVRDRYAPIQNIYLRAHGTPAGMDLGEVNGNYQETMITENTLQGERKEKFLSTLADKVNLIAESCDTGVLNGIVHKISGLGNDITAVGPDVSSSVNSIKVKDSGDGLSFEVSFEPYTPEVLSIYEFKRLLRDPLLYFRNPARYYRQGEPIKKAV